MQVLDRLLELGFTHAHANELTAALDEGFPDDCMPILLQYPETCAQFRVLQTATIYRCQMLTAKEAALPDGSILQFDADWKAWTTQRDVAESFADPFGAFVESVVLERNANSCDDTLDIGALLNCGRWVEYGEIWVKVPNNSYER